MQTLNRKQLKSIRRNITPEVKEPLPIRPIVTPPEPVIKEFNIDSLNESLAVANRASLAAVSAIDVINKQSDGLSGIIDAINSKEKKNITLKVNRNTIGLIDTINIIEE